LIEGALAGQSAGQAGHAGRLNPIYLEGKLFPLAAPAARELGLKDGEVVQALVQSRPGGDMALLLRGRLIDLPRPSPWVEGQTLNLKVQAAPSGPWALQLLPASTGLPSLPALLSAASETPLLFSKVANLLFRPAGLQELAQLFKPGTLDTLLQSVPRPDLQDQWRSLQLSMAQLTPQALSQAFAAGMGAEAWLARGLAAPVEDPKQLLRRLMAALARGDADDDSPEKISGLQRAVDDLEASQVQAVQAQSQSEVLMRMVLPFHDADPVELVFRRGAREGGKRPPLTVNVHSRSQVLGEIWLKTQLHTAEHVELTMWALQADVVRQAKSHAGELGRQLGDAGLTMKSFQIVHGARPSEPAAWRPSSRGMVVDVSA
jgi:hypothetical protein